jgi:hypothetical protein
VSSLRADAHLAAQADQLVSDVAGNVPGNAPFINTVKRGLVRAGGDLAPSNKLLWPQDFILGTGKSIKLYYNDLSIYEWVSGYTAITEILLLTMSLGLTYWFRGALGNYVYELAILPKPEYCIAHWEAINILVALCTFCPLLHHHRVIIWCDNTVAVNI